MTSDAKTLSVYDARAADYADMAVDPNQNANLTAFIAAMPKGGRVLDYGCGPGDSARIMQQRGLQVDAFDASREMVDRARQNTGINVRQMTFDDLDVHLTYDGIWASYSLLHAPKSAFPHHLQAIHRALIPRGLLAIAMKLGAGEHRDPIGRFYAYYSQTELSAHLTDAGFTPTDFSLGDSIGLAGVSAPYIAMNALA